MKHYQKRVTLLGVRFALSVVVGSWRPRLGWLRVWPGLTRYPNCDAANFFVGPFFLVLLRSRGSSPS